MVRESRLSSSSSSSPFFDGGGGEDATNSRYEVCRYPFLQLKDGAWINFSDALKQIGRLPAGCSADGDPADICLSYTFCRLLARRYFGFPCAEVGDPQVRDFVLTDLVAADYKRAFAIVEVQLALLHDYFFTNFHSELASGFVSLKQWTVRMSLLTVMFVASGAVSSLIRGDYKQGHSGLVYLCAYSIAAALMYIVIIHPQNPRLPSYWHPVQSLYRYYLSVAARRSPSSSHVDHHYWREKLSQYSVMEDYDQRSSKKTIIAWCKVHVLSQVSYSFIKHHPAEGEEVSVPDSVRSSVAHAIKDLNNGPPTIGSNKSLLPMVDDLSWTYRQETLTHTIIIWHIATCYCDMLSLSSQPLAAATENHEVATILSRYSAYLVAFLPELLPEHALTAKFVLQQVLQEPRDALGRTRMSMEAKIKRMQKLQLPEDESDDLNTFQKGVRLGRQLQQLADVSARWKAMADFWVEMIMYLACSSDNAAAHVEQLAQGGEFLTHIWALLCNAGIVKQATEEEWAPQHPPNMAREVKKSASARFPPRTKSA